MHIPDHIIRINTLNMYIYAAKTEKAAERTAKLSTGSFVYTYF